MARVCADRRLLRRDDPSRDRPAARAATTRPGRRDAARPCPCGGAVSAPCHGRAIRSGSPRNGLLAERTGPDG